MPANDSTVDDIPLTDVQREQTHALRALIATRIADAGGWIAFDDYMRQALYEPGLGYYSAGATKLGPDGDFTTAPELSDCLADALADFFYPILRALPSPRLLELGAGSGRLAVGLLQRLAGRDGLADLRYSILEPSPDLRERQQQALAGVGPVEWLEQLPDEPFDGVAFGNEVADALPVAVFEKQAGRAVPLGVALNDDRFVWRRGVPDALLEERVAAIERSLGRTLPDGFRSEYCPPLPDWIAALAGAIRRGGLLLIDYGLPTREYYHPDRDRGTLICHFRHRAHADPFLLPGLQDLTAWVDFGAAAGAGKAAGLAIAGFTTQGQFLLESLMHSDPATLASMSPAAHSALKTLMLPGEMGERFKLLWLSRHVGAPLPGRDFRSWL